MTGREPNRNTLWGSVLVEELVAGGLEAVCIAPGSRSTPLTVAFARHPEVTVYSHLDERSAAFFALGRGRRTGEPTALVCTSGTAAANFHPAVIEASQARVPLLVLTADRPPELRDSGANQTVDQVKLYGDAVRWYAQLPEPEADERKVRMLRTTAARALGSATGTPAGPVHLNCPFSKPLEPVPVPGDVPGAFAGTLAGKGREGAFVETLSGEPTLTDAESTALATALADADRPLFVAGPADPTALESIAPPTMALTRRLGAPVLADPLSGLRFGPHVDEHIFGGYDAYLSEAVNLDPDLVIRIGASPTSKTCRQYLQAADCRQLMVDPGGGWREATFSATDHIRADPGRLFASLVSALEGQASDGSESPSLSPWLERFHRAEADHWSATEHLPDTLEGAVLATAIAEAPDPATVFVSNSMPIRDADRFGEPQRGALTVLANRGASGIDGITSTALGAGSTLDDGEPLVLVTGDLAFYHDMNGLLALERCDVNATIVLINNDGGGIFHMLPIEAYEPPFTDQFKTPHGLDFSPLEELYELSVTAVEPSAFASAYRDALEEPNTQVLSLEFDAETSHDVRSAFDP